MSGGIIQTGGLSPKILRQLGVTLEEFQQLL